VRGAAAPPCSVLLLRVGHSSVHWLSGCWVCACAGSWQQADRVGVSMQRGQWAVGRCRGLQSAGCAGIATHSSQLAIGVGPFDCRGGAPGSCSPGRARQHVVMRKAAGTLRKAVHGVRCTRLIGRAGLGVLGRPCSLWFQTLGKFTSSGGELGVVTLSDLRAVAETGSCQV
jgi:hypothetical protein